MDSPESLPKLRMAPVETPEQLAHRAERERRAVELQREGKLEQSLAPFRVGSVNYLNAAPLVRGIEDELILATPAKLAEMLQRDELGLKSRYGLRYLFPDSPMMSVFEDGSTLALYRDPAKSAAQIAKFSKKDAEAYPKYERMLEKVASVIEPTLHMTPPNVIHPGITGAWSLRT